jgi:hypothetical protein
MPLVVLILSNYDNVADELEIHLSTYVLLKGNFGKT